MANSHYDAKPKERERRRNQDPDHPSSVSVQFIVANLILIKSSFKDASLDLKYVMELEKHKVELNFSVVT